MCLCAGPCRAGFEMKVTSTIKRATAQPLIPSESLLEKGAERDHYWHSLLASWRQPKRRTPTTFPGCNPRSLSRSDVPMLSRAPYLVSLKSDGVRYALFLTTRPGTGASGSHKAVALLADRAGNMYEIEVVAPETYFTLGTVLEGELVWREPGRTELILLVFDAVRVRGKSLLSAPFSERLAAAARCLRSTERPDTNADVEFVASEMDSILSMHCTPVLQIQVKSFVEHQHLMDVWAHRHRAQHRIDGLILARADRSYQMGSATRGEMYKWKEHITVDLRGRGADLSTSDGPIGDTLCGRRVHVSSKSEVKPAGDDDVVEYLLHVDDDSSVELFAIRTRPDKRVPNSRHVVEASLTEACNPVALDSLSVYRRNQECLSPDRC